MGGKKTKIDLEQLRYEIQHLNNRKDLYYVLKEELIKRHWWKQKARGDPVKAYRTMREKRGK
jgi:hypothetical protein